MSICESDHSESSSGASVSTSSKASLSPELRLRPKNNNGFAAEDKTQAHLSCPDLETMVARASLTTLSAASNQCITIPNRAIEQPRKISAASDLESEAVVGGGGGGLTDHSPLLSRRRKLHDHAGNLPKFSISMEDAKGPDFKSASKAFHRYVISVISLFQIPSFNQLGAIANYNFPEKNIPKKPSVLT
jgi:hypothetical protein